MDEQMTIVEAPDDALEQAQRLLQESKATRYREIQEGLGEFKRRLRFELVGVPKYVPDGNSFKTAVDVMIVLVDE